MLVGPASPEGAIGTSSAIVTWTPAAAQVGTVHVGISATDGQDTTTQFFDLPVVLNASNRPPQITSQPRGSVRLGDTFTFLVETFDPDSEPVTLKLTNNPPGMVLSNAQPSSLNSQVLQWTPTTLGSNYYELVLSDGRATVTIGYRLLVVTQSGKALPLPPHRSRSGPSPFATTAPATLPIA